MAPQMVELKAEQRVGRWAEKMVDYLAVVWGLLMAGHLGDSMAGSWGCLKVDLKD